MNKQFIKSMATAIAGLSLVSSCAMMDIKSDSHKCGGKNDCKGKKMEGSSKCSTKKEESNFCGAKNGCAAAKDSKTSKTNKTSKAKK